MCKQYFILILYVIDGIIVGLAIKYGKIKLFRTLGNTVIFKKCLGDRPEMFLNGSFLGEMLGIIFKMFHRNFIGVPTLHMFPSGLLLGQGNLESITRFWFQGKDLVPPGNQKSQDHVSFLVVKISRMYLKSCFFDEIS